MQKYFLPFILAVAGAIATNTVPAAQYFGNAYGTYNWESAVWGPNGTTSCGNNNWTEGADCRIMCSSYRNSGHTFTINLQNNHTAGTITGYGYRPYRS